MTKNWRKKITAEKIFFRSKTTIYLSLGLHNERPSYWRSLQLSKEAIQHFKHKFLKFFSIFVGHFCPPGSGSGSTDPIRIRNPGTDCVVRDPARPAARQSFSYKWGAAGGREKYMFMFDWSAIMTPQKATLDSMRTLSWFVSYRRLLPQFQSAAALGIYLYVCHSPAWHPTGEQRRRGSRSRLPHPEPPFLHTSTLNFWPTHESFLL